MGQLDPASPKKQPQSTQSKGIFLFPLNKILLSVPFVVNPRKRLADYVKILKPEFCFPEFLDYCVLGTIFH